MKNGKIILLMLKLVTKKDVKRITKYHHMYMELKDFATAPIIRP